MTPHTPSTQTDPTAYPTPWVAQALCDPQPQGARVLVRKLSRDVYEQCCVWPGDPLYPDDDSPAPATEPSAAWDRPPWTCIESTALRAARSPSSPVQE